MRRCSVERPEEVADLGRAASMTPRRMAASAAAWRSEPLVEARRASMPCGRRGRGLSHLFVRQNRGWARLQLKARYRGTAADEACITDEQLLDLLERRLGEAERRQFVAHVGSCASCRGMAAVDSPDAAEPGLPFLRGTNVGRFVILDHVGSGAMGEVFPAYDSELDRKVAIKLLHDDAGPRSDELRPRLAREAKALAKLSHPNVVHVYDTGVHDGRTFVAMELVAGRTLRAWLAERPRGWREAVAVLSLAGRGLAAAHDARIVHRDFKPDNVLVGDDGRVRVADFGLAGGDHDGAPHPSP